MAARKEGGIGCDFDVARFNGALDGFSNYDDFSKGILCAGRLCRFSGLCQPSLTNRDTLSANEVIVGLRNSFRIRLRNCSSCNARMLIASH